jgi:hypothetical protein
LKTQCLELDKKIARLETAVLELKTQISAQSAGTKKTALKRKGDDDLIPELSDKDNNDELTTSEKTQKAKASRI